MSGNFEKRREHFEFIKNLMNLILGIHASVSSAMRAVANGETAEMSARTDAGTRYDREKTVQIEHLS